MKPTDPLVEHFTSSIGFDIRLAKYDVEGSIAHAKMLGRCKIISARESQRLVGSLKSLLRRIKQGRFKADPSVEDVHTQVQQALEKLAGPVARKIQTARSRNDQVSLDMRLYCRDVVNELRELINLLQKALVRLASVHSDVVIPGYTHLQQAQPILLAHQLLAYVEMVERDAERLTDSLRRIDVLPLGSCALAGTSLPIDRRYVAKLLGFSNVSANSVDAVSDRDFAMELMCVVASLNVHLSRMAEDFILLCTEEFGILVIDDAFATGSSLLPQKHNPDVLELIRGQAGFVTGQLTAFLTVLKGLPLAYNRDLQWDKPLVFGSVEATKKALCVLERFVWHLKVDRAQAKQLLKSDGLCATDLAEYLVGRGVAFRDAHESVGKLIGAAKRQGKRLAEFSLKELKRFAPQCDKKVYLLFDPRRSVLRKRSFGSTNPKQVGRAIRNWRIRLNAR